MSVMPPGQADAVPTRSASGRVSAPRVELANEETMEQKITIDGMHCQGCANKVTRLLKSMPGIAAASVTLPNLAIIDCTTRLSSAHIQAHLSQGGVYAVREGWPSILERHKQFLPLFWMFVAVVAWATVAAAPFGHHWAHDCMRHFMGGFFLLFGGLKLWNLRGFASMYASYDVLAKRVPAWGYMYPFVEVGLGILYTVDLWQTQANVATAVLMAFGAIGIVQKLRQGGSVTCACLGGVFAVPLTWVTVAENILMVVMAIWMLIYH